MPSMYLITIDCAISGEDFKKVMREIFGMGLVTHCVTSVTSRLFQWIGFLDFFLLRTLKIEIYAFMMMTILFMPTTPLLKPMKR